MGLVVPTCASYVVLLLRSYSLLAFLQSRPSEPHLRSHVLPKVGGKWKAVSTFLGIPHEMVETKLQSHFGKVDEAFFALLCLWRAGEGATWDTLLDALKEAGLNAPVRELLEWIEFGAASVSCVVLMWRDAYRDILQ